MIETESLFKNFNNGSAKRLVSNKGSISSEAFKEDCLRNIKAYDFKLDLN